MTDPLVFNIRVKSRRAAVQTRSHRTAVSVGDRRVIVVAVPGGRGADGPAGASGANAPRFGVTPSGAVNGLNLVFTTPQTFAAGSVCLYLNGLRETHFTETGAAQITLETPPGVSDTLRVDYLIQ